MKRFYIKPAVPGFDKDWPDSYQDFKKLIKESFVPVNGTNGHFPISPYALPYPFDVFASVNVGFVVENGRRWNLSIEMTPGASVRVYGMTEFSLRIEEV